MNIGVFLGLLMAFSVIASVVTEGIKMFLDGMKVNYASNILVLGVSMVVGAGGTALFYVNYQVPFNALNSVYLALMGIANWLVAMLGYDKIKQAIEQIRNIRRE